VDRRQHHVPRRFARQGDVVGAFEHDEPGVANAGRKFPALVQRMDLSLRA
jgi:hypothetical protein